MTRLASPGLPRLRRDGHRRDRRTRNVRGDGSELPSAAVELTSAGLDNDGFPFGTAQRIEVAGHDVLAMRMTYVGELGWELYVPWDEAPAAV